MEKIELLAPAGDMEKLKTALHFGADAVYFAGKNYGLRAFGTNFETQSLKETVEYVHSFGKKAYVTINIYARDNDFDGLAAYLKELEDAKVDAVLVSDMGVLHYIKKHAPKLNIHISTQANTTNKYAVEAYKNMGASRVVLARELNLDEIKSIHKHNPKVELEAFVHGAMCISYSGRCLLSNYLTGRDSNHGECVQACRWEYFVTEKNRPDEHLEIKEQYQDCIIFYRLGDFYEMFFDDALAASRELEITLTGRDCGQEERAPMCGVPFHAAESYIARLIEKGYKVAICEQLEDAKEAKGMVKRRAQMPERGKKSAGRIEQPAPKSLL